MCSGGFAKAHRIRGTESDVNRNWLIGCAACLWLGVTTVHLVSATQRDARLPRGAEPSVLQAVQKPTPEAAAAQKPAAPPQPGYIGDDFYAIVPGGPLTAPNQLPDVFNKLQHLHIDVRHMLSNRLVANVACLYEPFRVYDFAFDQAVVNGIVQSSSLVLGYVHRPYTAHSERFGLRYYW
jgi:hypothetical protein